MRNGSLGFLILFAAVSAHGLYCFAASSSQTLTVTITPTVITSVGGPEEFVGPFANWINAKTGKRYDGTGPSLCTAATGDGVTDDTTALQSCLTALNAANPVLRLPASTYLISAHLNLPAGLYFSVIGEDPATTKIKWNAAAGLHTMILVNGSAYSRINRITLDGQNAAYAGIIQEWDGISGVFDTGNEYADVVFLNLVTYGMICGNAQGCAEISMLRDQFLNTGRIGLSMGEAGGTNDFNALDMWCWYCNFSANNIAAANTDGAGNLHIFNSNFSGSTVADIALNNTGIFSFMYNYSAGSNQFLNCSFSNNPNNVTVEANIILDTTLAKSINCNNLGPLVGFDNGIRSQLAATAPIVDMVGGDLFSTGNYYTVSSPLNGNRIHSLGDSIVSIATFNSTFPTTAPILPGVPPNNARAIFEVPAGSSAATIQTAINNAVSAGRGSVVHLQNGNYSIASGLTVPAGNFIQIIGDGGGTLLTWSGAANGSMLTCIGPCIAVFRDFQLNGNSGAANGVVITNADQTGARVFGEQLLLNGSTTSGLVADSLNNANVEMHDMQVAGDGIAINCIGGSAIASGALNIYAAAANGNGQLFALSNGCVINAKQMWNDASATTSSVIAALSGTGKFGAAGLAAYLGNSVTTTHTIALNNWTGTSAILNANTSISSLLADELISGSSGSGSNNLTIGLVGKTAAPFSDTTSPADTSGFLNPLSTFCVGAGTCPGAGGAEIAESGSSTLSFVNAALAPLRAAKPTVPGPLASGVTDARLYRVYTQDTINGLSIRH